MPKAKLEVKLSDLKKLKVASELTRVTLEEKGSKKAGEMAYITASTPDPGNFFKLGQMMSVVTGNEFDADEKDSSEKEGKKK